MIKLYCYIKIIIKIYQASSKVANSVSNAKNVIMMIKIIVAFKFVNFVKERIVMVIQIPSHTYIMLHVNVTCYIMLHVKIAMAKVIMKGV